MCSIYGAVGHKGKINFVRFRQLKEQAGDRGRDGGRYETFELTEKRQALLGQWRATPVTEAQRAPFQPYEGVVHNGTIANDKELGGKPGDVDSMVLPKVLDRSSHSAFATSIGRLKGSYAIACASRNTVFLACNYKPLYYWRDPEGTIFFSSMERHFEGICTKFERPAKLPPYSTMDLLSGDIRSIPRQKKQRAVVIFSTGLDSTVVAAKLIREGWDVHLLHFKYGCKAERREVERVQRIAYALGSTYSFLPVDFQTVIGAKATILGQGEIGSGKEGAEYAVDWVPARNLVMLALATAYAEANGYHAIALGNNLEESGAFPDNEEEFTKLFDDLLPYAVQNGYKVQAISPVGHLMKNEIVKLGVTLDAPLEHTWSCYRDGDVHCGQCSSCFIRKSAFARCGILDPAFANREVP